MKPFGANPAAPTHRFVDDGSGDGSCAVCGYSDGLVGRIPPMHGEPARPFGEVLDDMQALAKTQPELSDDSPEIRNFVVVPPGPGLNLYKSRNARPDHVWQPRHLSVYLKAFQPGRSR